MHLAQGFFIVFVRKISLIDLDRVGTAEDPTGIQRENPLLLGEITVEILKISVAKPGLNAYERGLFIRNGPDAQVREFTEVEYQAFLVILGHQTHRAGFEGVKDKRILRKKLVAQGNCVLLIQEGDLIPL